MLSYSPDVFVSENCIRYFYLADSDVVGEVVDGDEGELWAFAAAILPLIHECDEDVGNTVRINTDISLSSIMVDGYVHVKEQVESVYSCLGIKCSDVGGYVGDGTEYKSDFGPCSDGDDSGELEEWEVAIVVIVVLAVVGVGGFFCFRRFRRSKSASSTTTTVDGLGGFDKPSSTL